tara:strand:- start:688 stop:1560 length:873 start_codon:yes stop_codon:yes gene_type:complete
MKTVIDAVNEFFAKYSMDTQGNDERLIIERISLSKGYPQESVGDLFYGYAGFNEDMFSQVCNENEFNDLVSQMETNFGLSVTYADWLTTRNEYGQPHGVKSNFISSAVSHMKSDKELEVMDKIGDACCSVCNCEFKCKISEMESMACPRCGDIPEPSKPKPVFTQEMCDNGESPSVGMEFLMKHKDADESWAQPDFHPAKMKAIGDELFIIESLSECNRLKESVGTIDDYLFKPLTPPIELIDGKAYQFDYDGDTFQGIYSERGDDFHSNKFVSSAPICTNIQPLTVGVK